MGTDIHGVIEQRQDDGRWVTIRTLNHNSDLQHAWSWHPALIRNYARFAALASVRGAGLPARGLPDDASETARVLFDQDSHTSSWLPIEDAARIFVETEREKLSDFDRQYPCATYFSVEEKHGFERHRLVFWFDS